jgi:hypothetical protein
VIAFLIRLAGYALLLELSLRVAQNWWVQYGLDDVASVQPLHDAAVLAIHVATVVLALIGFGPLRNVAVFIGFALAAAVLTAPAALARFVLG